MAFICSLYTDSGDITLIKFNCLDGYLQIKAGESQGVLTSVMLLRVIGHSYTQKVSL